MGDGSWLSGRLRFSALLCVLPVYNKLRTLLLVREDVSHEA